MLCIHFLLGFSKLLASFKLFFEVAALVESHFGSCTLRAHKIAAAAAAAAASFDVEPTYSCIGADKVLNEDDN